MPKILINEKDYTKPGAPGEYANYSVLIAGLQQEFTEEALSAARNELNNYNAAVEKAKVDETIELPVLSADAKMLKARDERADYNGVYEFSSSQDFLNTIGAVAPQVEVSVDYQVGETEGTIKNAYKHYGNQMAYELLKQGYTVLYLPIKSTNPAETLINEDTWEIFKDKASYDFRFVSHGLLESNEAFELSSITEYRIASEELYNLTHDLEEAIAELNKIEEEANSLEAQITDGTFEKAQFCSNYYAFGATYAISKKEDDKISEYYKKFNGFKNSEGEYYRDFSEALIGTTAALALAQEAADNSKQTLKAFEEALNKHIINIDSSVINTANSNIASLAKYADDESDDKIPGRGDCIALIELDEKAYVNVNGSIKPETAIIDAVNELSIDKSNGKYCALTVPSVIYNMADTTVSINGDDAVNVYASNKKFPGGFHYLVCFMNALRSNFREWYAAAGYTRGVSSYTIQRTTVPLGEVAINALEPRARSVTGPKFACNVIANFRGSYYLWGNRTAHLLDTKASGGDLVASHFLNIRQLCCTIKKQLYVACRRFTFDPNSDTLWFNFVNAIKPTLEVMKADQGIRDYKIMKVTTDKKATLKAKIRIIPIEAVEDFDLEVSLEDSFGETTAVVTG